MAYAAIALSVATITPVLVARHYSRLAASRYREAAALYRAPRRR